MNRNWAIFFAILAVFSVRDAFINGEQQQKPAAANSGEDFSEFDEEPVHETYTKTANDPSEFDDEVEIRDPTDSAGHGQAFHVPLTAPPVRFSYCVSCGYRQAFEQFSQIITEKFPGIVIEGGNYPPSAVKSIIAQVIGILKIGIIASIIFNRNPFETFGLATPSIYTWMTTNKVSACMMLFMFSNSIESTLMSTGAFEIYVGDELIWSKIESGRVPSPTELIQAIQSQLQLAGTKLAGGSDAFELDD
uniref:SelT-like protein n=1 Tax=Panagrellus redivivus TaxID=6233 RepID=A0A7E4V1X3_PANRE